MAKLLYWITLDCSLQVYLMKWVVSVYCGFKFDDYKYYQFLRITIALFTKCAIYTGFDLCYICTNSTVQAEWIGSVGEGALATMCGGWLWVQKRDGFRVKTPLLEQSEKGQPLVSCPDDIREMSPISGYS